MEKDVITYEQRKKTKTIALLRGITSKTHYDFYCLNYLHSFATKNTYFLNVKIKDFCNVIMLHKTLKY